MPFVRFRAHIHFVRPFPKREQKLDKVKRERDVVVRETTVMQSAFTHIDSRVLDSSPKLKQLHKVAIQMILCTFSCSCESPFRLGEWLVFAEKLTSMHACHVSTRYFHL